MGGEVDRASKRDSCEVLFELRQEDREPRSVQGVRFLLRPMPRILHNKTMSRKIFRQRIYADISSLFVTCWKKPQKMQVNKLKTGLLTTTIRSPTLRVPTSIMAMTPAGQTMAQTWHPVHLSRSMSSFPRNLGDYSGC